MQPAMREESMGRQAPRARAASARASDKLLAPELGWLLASQQQAACVPGACA